jgi:pimeloyl-ACP methyl ester carboxylesterase
VSTVETALVHRMAEVEPGVRLHYVEAGDGPLVVLLHGFPEFWYSWRSQIPALAEAGLRVVAPDMRGYNLSDKPRGAKAYAIETLARDVARLLDVCGAERACVVGHDWGAVVAWWFAMLYPERLDRLAILNVPHPLKFQRALRTLSQLRKSWYMFFFQLPWLPEAMIRASIRHTLGAMVQRGSFSAADVDRYVEAILRPGALTAGINYYRALFRYGLRTMRRLRRIDAPVLVIWGERDPYIGRELADPPHDWVPNVRVERLPNASHWVQNDQPQRVNELLTDFLRATPLRSSQ